MCILLGIRASAHSLTIRRVFFVYVCAYSGISTLECNPWLIHVLFSIGKSFKSKSLAHISSIGGCSGSFWWVICFLPLCCAMAVMMTM